MTGRVLQGKGILFGRRKHFEEVFDFGGFWVNQKKGAPVCWGFWAQGPGYPYGILELGI